MFSYGKDIEIAFDSRVTQLVGKNGSGKSSIPAILEDLFYNKTSRGVKKKSIKNRYVEDSWYSSECEFTINSDEYVLSKRVTSKTDLKLIKNGSEDLSGHTATQTYETVKQLLGMDFNTFTKLVYQSMLSNLDFLVATDANRKKFLISLLGLEGYAEIAEKIKKLLSNTKTEITKTEATIKALLSQKPTNIPEIKEKKPAPETSNKLIQLEKELEEVLAHNQQIERLNDRIDNNNAAIKRLDSIQLPEAPSEVSFDYDVQAEKTKLSNQLAIKESELKTLSTPATKCPTCGTPYNNDDHVKHIETKKAELTKEIAQIKQDLESVILDSTKLTQYELDLKKVKDALKLKEELEKSIDRSIPAEKQSTKPTQNLKDKIKSIKEEIEEVRKYNSQVDQDNARAEALIEQLQKLNDSIKVEESKVQNLRNSKEKLEILNEAFGTKGLISYKIESLTKTFEGLINEYLSIFTDGRFNLIFQIEDTKLALKLFDDGEEIEIASLSSGEFNKVNTSTLLAIRKMMVAVSKININILFLDEVVSVLDEESKDTLIEVLLNEKEINSVVVSHGYSHPLTNIIKIKNEDKVSYVE